MDNPLPIVVACMEKSIRIQWVKECLCIWDKQHNYIPINDTTFELSVFWPSDTESHINELRFSESISLSFKTRLTLVT